MNNLLKFKDNKIKQLIEYIRDSIKDSYFEGHVYIVGGTVRDSILGNDIHDIDLAIDLAYGDVGFANFMTFKDGSLKQDSNPVVLPKCETYKFKLLNNKDFSDIEIECTQTIKTKEKLNDKSKSFGTVEQDAEMRDFTINSIYYNISTDELKDFTNKGFSDISNKILRTCNKPDVTFDSDPIRIIRVLRLASTLGFKIEKETWLSMLKNSNKVLNLSSDSIINETKKILVSEKPSVAIKYMLRCNELISYILPSLQIQQRIKLYNNLDVTLLDNTLDILDTIEPKLEYRLSALLCNLGKVKTYKNNFTNNAEEGAVLSKKWLETMGFPIGITNKVSLAIKLHESFIAYKGKNLPSKSSLREFKANVGENYDLALALIDAINKNSIYKKNSNQVSIIRNKITALEKKDNKNLSVVKLPINGSDIINKFSLKTSPLIGTLLKTVKKEYFNNPNITKEECFEIISKLI